MRARGADLVRLLLDPNTCAFICSRKDAEQGVNVSLAAIGIEHDLDWVAIG